MIIPCHSTGDRGFGQLGPDGFSDLCRGRPISDLKGVAVRQSDFQELPPGCLGTVKRHAK
jgi:hypothetical protein